MVIKRTQRGHHEIVGKRPHQMHTNDSQISMNNQGILVFLVASNLNSRYIQSPLVSFYKLEKRMTKSQKGDRRRHLCAIFPVSLTSDSHFSMNMQGIILFLVASNRYSRFIQ